jgi:hypothetical protein
MAIKMKNNSNDILKLEDGKNRCGNTICKVVDQSSILIEAGKNAVADASAVDGINFKIKYELTTDDNKIIYTQITENPCAGLDKKYQQNIGCHNPSKVDCTSDTCKCKPSSQQCEFNQCSQDLFNIPDDLKKYINNYDSGKPNPGQKMPPVKHFIGNYQNMKNNSLKQFCKVLHSNYGDFTTYCYDYDDASSSPYLRSPYKMKITFSDLK